MKCRCCNYEFPKDEGTCPRCGFPVIYMADEEDAGSIQQITESVRAYRRKHFGSLQISVNRYTWKKAGDHIELDQKLQTPLCTAAELLEQEEIILDQRFARTPSAQTVALEYSLGGVPGKALIPAPTDVSFWQVGVRSLEGLRFCFLLKSDSQLNISQPIGLLQADAGRENAAFLK